MENSGGTGRQRGTDGNGAGVDHAEDGVVICGAVSMLCIIEPRGDIVVCSMQSRSVPSALSVLLVLKWRGQSSLPSS